jgi:opacity protein-like surface antigen
MKTKKLFLMAAVITATAFSTVSAQRKSQTATPIKFSVGLELGAPTGVYKNTYNAGLGGSGKIEIPATTQLFITATAGFTSFYYKENQKNALKALGLPTTQGFVPLKVGGKYYFSPAFYAEGEIGASIGTNKGSSTAFAYAPGIGVSIPLIGRNALDVGLRYEGWSQDYSFNQLGLRVAYKF